MGSEWNKTRALPPRYFSGGAQGPHGLKWDQQAAMSEIQRLNSLLVQSNANFPALIVSFFTAKPLPPVPFTLPDGSLLQVGGEAYLTGELTFPLKLLPVSVYFLPDSALSHTLFGVCPLIRPQGRCVFTNTSCLFFDAPDSTAPFLQGSKTPDSDLWFLQVPTPSTLHHAPSTLFTLQELPCARFVAYWHRAFGSPSLSTFIDALASDFISIPRLTPTLVRKYSPLSCATSFGHLDTLRQGISSTRRSPSPHALGSSASPLSRKSRRRMTFLKD
jgi:hypothetical protein